MLLPIAAVESASIRASQPARRVAHADLADAAERVHEAPQPPAAFLAPAASAASGSMDTLRDQYADERLRCAVERYQSPGSRCGCEGADWGLLDCLLPSLPYRFAPSNPPVEVLGTVVPPALRPLAAPRLENIGLDDGFESARQRRRRPANWP